MAKWKNDNLLIQDKPLGEKTLSKNRKLKEGVGAGYKLTFYGIKLTNVKLGKVKESGWGDKVPFTADIVPTEVEFSCDHPYWFVDSNTTWIDTGEVEVDTGATEAKIVGGSVKGIYDIDYDGWTEEDIVEEISSMTYDISDIYSGGYIHQDITETIKMDSKYGVSDFYLLSATVKLDKDTVDMMNTVIEIAEDPEGYYFGEVHGIK